MKLTEFHQINEKYLNQILPEKYKKITNKSTWRKQLSEKIELEFALRMDRDGWDEICGSLFVYEVRPIYQGKLLYDKVRPLNIVKLAHYDSNLAPKIQGVLTSFAEHLPVVSGPEASEYYLSLKSVWTDAKVKQFMNSSSWYYFYNAEDLTNWHEALAELLTVAIEERESEYLRYDFDRTVDKNILQKPKRMIMAIDPRTGEMTLTEKE